MDSPRNAEGSTPRSKGVEEGVPVSNRLFLMFSFVVLQTAALAWNWAEWPDQAGVTTVCAVYPGSSNCILLRTQQTAEVMAIIGVILGGIAMIITALGACAHKGIVPESFSSASLEKLCPVLFFCAAISTIVTVTVLPGRYANEHEDMGAHVWLGLQITATVLSIVTCVSLTEDPRAHLVTLSLLLAMPLQICALALIHYVWNTAGECGRSGDKRECRAKLASEVFGIVTAICGGFALLASFLSSLAAAEVLPAALNLLKGAKRIVLFALCLLPALFSLLACMIWPGTVLHDLFESSADADGFVADFRQKQWLSLQIAVAALCTGACFFTVPFNNWRKHAVPAMMLGMLATQISALAVMHWRTANSVKDDYCSGSKTYSYCVVQRAKIVSETFGIIAAILGGFTFALSWINSLAQDEVLSSGRIPKLSFVMTCITFLSTLVAVVPYPATVLEYQRHDNNFAGEVESTWLKLQLAAAALTFGGMFCFIPFTKNLRSFFVAALCSGFVAVQMAALIEVDWPKPKHVTNMCDDKDNSDCRVARAALASEALAIIGLLLGGAVWIISLINAMARNGLVEEKLDTARDPNLHMIPVALSICAAICCVLSSVVWPATYAYKIHLTTFNSDTIRYTWLQLQITSAAAIGMSIFFHVPVNAWRRHLVTAALLGFFALQAAALSLPEWPAPKHVTAYCHKFGKDGREQTECIQLRILQATETWGIIASIFGGFTFFYSAICGAMEKSCLHALPLILTICTGVSALVAVVIPACFGNSTPSSEFMQLQIVATILAVLSVPLAALNTFSPEWVQPDEDAHDSGNQMNLIK